MSAASPDSPTRLFQIQVDEKGKIVDARFKTFGCGSAIASSSLATEWVKGKTVRSLANLTESSHVFHKHGSPLREGSSGWRQRGAEITDFKQNTF